MQTCWQLVTSRAKTTYRRMHVCYKLWDIYIACLGRIWGLYRLREEHVGLESSLTIITVNSLPFSRAFTTTIHMVTISPIFTLTFLFAFLSVSPKLTYSYLLRARYPTVEVKTLFLFERWNLVEFGLATVAFKPATSGLAVHWASNVELVGSSPAAAKYQHLDIILLYH